MKMLSEQPVMVDSRKDFMEYICSIHNTVNARIGKKKFDCSLVTDVWGAKGCGCKVKDIKSSLGVKAKF